MDSLAKRDMLITKEVMSTGRAISKFKRYRMKDKVNLFKYRRASSVKFTKWKVLRIILRLYGIFYRYS